VSPSSSAEAMGDRFARRAQRSRWSRHRGELAGHWAVLIDADSGQRLELTNVRAVPAGRRPVHTRRLRPVGAQSPSAVANATYPLSSNADTAPNLTLRRPARRLEGVGYTMLSPSQRGFLLADRDTASELPLGYSGARPPQDEVLSLAGL